jgi:hypothetical protein
MRRSVTLIVSLLGVLLITLLIATQSTTTAAVPPSVTKAPCAGRVSVPVPFDICPLTGKEPNAAAKGAGILKAAVGLDPCEPLTKCDKNTYCPVTFVTPVKPITCRPDKAKNCWACKGTVLFDCGCQ